MHLWSSSWDCGQIWCYYVQNDLGRFWDPIVSSLVLRYLFCSIHVTGVNTEHGGAYSSGAPGRTSILDVHVFTQFYHTGTERPTDLWLWITTFVLLHFNNYHWAGGYIPRGYHGSSSILNIMENNNIENIIVAGTEPTLKRFIVVGNHN